MDSECVVEYRFFPISHGASGTFNFVFINCHFGTYSPEFCTMEGRFESIHRTLLDLAIDSF